MKIYSKLTFIAIICSLLCFHLDLSAQSYNTNDLLKAIGKKDLNQLINYNSRNPEYFIKAASVILVPAVDGGDLDIVKYLIKNGADVDYRLGEVTPLDVAAEWADYRMIDLLCQNGARGSRNEGSATGWGTPKMTLTSMKLVFKQRNLSIGSKERNGITRQIRYDDILKSLGVLKKYQ